MATHTQNPTLTKRSKNENIWRDQACDRNDFHFSLWVLHGSRDNGQACSLVRANLARNLRVKRLPTTSAYKVADERRAGAFPSPNLETANCHDEWPLCQLTANLSLPLSGSAVADGTFAKTPQISFTRPAGREPRGKLSQGSQAFKLEALDWKNLLSVYFFWAEQTSVLPVEPAGNGGKLPVGRREGNSWISPVLFTKFLFDFAWWRRFVCTLICFFRWLEPGKKEHDWFQAWFLFQSWVFYRQHATGCIANPYAKPALSH